MPVKPKTNPPACELWDAFDYKPLTGELIRKTTNRSCGSLQLGYAKVWFIRKSWKRSRLVWTWVTGKDSAQQIDHKNQIRDDDRIWNLREASPTLQNINKRVWGRGYRWDKGSYETYRQFNGQRIKRRFKTEAECISFLQEFDAIMAKNRLAFDGQVRSG